MFPKISTKEDRQYVPPVTRLRLREIEASKQLRANQLLEICRRRRQKASQETTEPFKTPLRMEPQPPLDINTSTSIAKQKRPILKRHTATSYLARKAKTRKHNKKRKTPFFSTEPFIKPSAKWDLPMLKQAINRIEYTLSCSPDRRTKSVPYRRTPNMGKGMSGYPQTRNAAKKGQRCRKRKLDLRDQKKGNCAPRPRKKRKLPIIEIRSCRSALEDLQSKANLPQAQEARKGQNVRSVQPARVNHSSTSEFLFDPTSENFGRTQKKEELIQQWLKYDGMLKTPTTSCNQNDRRSRSPIQNSSELVGGSNHGKAVGEPEILICTCRHSQEMGIGRERSVLTAARGSEEKTQRNVLYLPKECPTRTTLADTRLVQHGNPEPLVTKDSYRSGDSDGVLQEMNAMASNDVGTSHGLPSGCFKQFVKKVYGLFME